MVGTVHLICAGVLFVALAIFSLLQFTKTDPGTTMTPRKRIRNRVYRFCGWTIVACIVLICVSNVVHWHLLFWFESVAVLAFGASWLVKSGSVPIFNDENTAS